MLVIGSPVPSGQSQREATVVKPEGLSVLRLEERQVPPVWQQEKDWVLHV
jgi:hypothetical protein